MALEADERGSLERAPLPRSSGAVPAPPPGAPADPLHVPTAEELRSRAEVASLRERLAAAEAELARLRRTPSHVAHAWLRQRMRR